MSVRHVGLTCLAVLAALTAGSAIAARAAQTFDIGLAADGSRIDALEVTASVRQAPTVVLVGGLHGDGADSTAVRAALTAYGRRHRRAVNLLAVPLANPDGAGVAFPATGAAYREHPEANVVWRWLGARAPDLVLVAGDDAGLAQALDSQPVAGMGRIPAHRWPGTLATLDAILQAPIAPSEAHAQLDHRRARSARQLAQLLARRYGRDFDQPWYIGALALIARDRLGDTDDVRRLVEPYVDGRKDSLAHMNALVMAGHLVFADLARRTGDPRYLALVRKVADLGFDASGAMLPAMPYNDGFSDSLFMGTAILVQAGALTGEQRYFDMADRHLRYMQGLDLRPDGLYRHQPATDAAWGRGNAFAALGLALMLSDLPPGHPGYAPALSSYRQLMAALLALQTRDGLWRNVLDHPGAYGEFSATAMFGFALQRGLARGWISGRDYQAAVERAWAAVNSRTSDAGEFIDVCESTARMTSLQQYLDRTAILGQDARAGAMAMLFATELMPAM